MGKDGVLLNSYFISINLTLPKQTIVAIIA